MRLYLISILFILSLNKFKAYQLIYKFQNVKLNLFDETDPSRNFNYEVQDIITALPFGLFAAGSCLGRLRIFDTNYGEIKHEFPNAHWSNITHIQKLDHPYLATSSLDGTIKIWDYLHGSHETTLYFDQTEPILGFSFFRSLKLMADEWNYTNMGF